MSASGSNNTHKINYDIGIAATLKMLPDYIETLNKFYNNKNPSPAETKECDTVLDITYSALFRIGDTLTKLESAIKTYLEELDNRGLADTDPKYRHFKTMHDTLWQTRREVARMQLAAVNRDQFFRTFPHQYRSPEKLPEFKDQNAFLVTMAEPLYDKIGDCMKAIKPYEKGHTGILKGLFDSKNQSGERAKLYKEVDEILKQEPDLSSLATAEKSAPKKGLGS